MLPMGIPSGENFRPAYIKGNETFILYLKVFLLPPCGKKQQPSNQRLKLSNRNF